MISKEEVIHIAKLARLNLSGKEIERLQKELSMILDYIEKLKEVNVEKAEPTSHSVVIKNIIREDKAQINNAETREKLLGEIPDKKGDYLKVKSIF